ncbi:MAG: LysM domain-containing protein, partial [Robiginitomaculum sp.]
AARTIRVAVDGSTQVFEIDASGVARPQSRSITHTQIYQPTPQNHTQVYQAPSYQEPTRTYRVRRGDTLYSIARRKCVALEDLTGANNIRRPYTIVPDQQLTLPRGAC